MSLSVCVIYHQRPLSTKAPANTVQHGIYQKDHQRKHGDLHHTDSCRRLAAFCNLPKIVIRPSAVTMAMAAALEHWKKASNEGVNE